jgi:hypothetical protein
MEAINKCCMSLLTYTGRQRRFRLPVENEHRQAMDDRPQWAWKNDRMEPSRIESALASARWALCCFFISTPGVID